MRLTPARPIDHYALGLGTLFMAAMELLFPNGPGWLPPALVVLLTVQALYWFWLATRGRKNPSDRGTRPVGYFFGAGMALAAAVALFLHDREWSAVAMAGLATAIGLWCVWRGVRTLRASRELEAGRQADGAS